MITNFSKNQKSFDWRKNFRIVFLWSLLLAILFFLIVTNIKIYQRREKMKIAISNIKKEIQEIDAKNKNLEKTIRESGNKEYLEKVAREQFNLKAPGEEVAIVLNNEEKAGADILPENNIGNKIEKSFFQKLASDFKEIFHYFSQ